MPDISFRVLDVSALRYAAVPTLAARLQISNAVLTQPIHSMSVHCQVNIEPLSRSYSPAEEARLLDLFGERERWARSMKPLLWTNAVLGVPGFVENIEIDLPLPCTLDFEVAATKYFYGLEKGSVRGSILFSGTVFYAGASGLLQVMQIPWQNEARFEVAVDKWREAIDAHYPESIWLRLPRDTFDRLYRYRVVSQIPTWNRLIEHLLDCAVHESADDHREVQPHLESLAGVQS
jgi:hypothetical protein